MTEQLNVEGARESIRLVLAKMPEGESPYARAMEGTWRWLDAEVDRLREENLRLDSALKAADAARMRAEQRAERSVAVLKSVEWGGGLVYDIKGKAWATCPKCKQEIPDHNDDCELAAVLEGAGE